MEVSRFVQLFKPVYPEPLVWDSTVQFMKDDPIEWGTVLGLIDDYVSQGGFREPVIVDHSGNVVDGTHRVVVSIILGVDVFYCVVGDVVYEKFFACNTRCEDEHLYDVEVTFLDELGEDEWDSLFDYVTQLLRSVRLDDNSWVSSSMSSGRKNGVGVSFHCENDKVKDNLETVVQQIILDDEKLSKMDSRVEVVAFVDLFDD